MAADPQPQDAQSDDLFGRWLAHHEQQGTDGDETGSAQGTTDHNPPPRASRRMPAAAVASSAVQNDPLIGNRLQAPSTFGVRRPSPNAQPRSGSGSNELNPEPPSGWEPIVVRSVRKKSEPRVNPLDQPSRFQRLKARFVDPKEPTGKTEVAPAPAQPGRPVTTQAPPLPTRSPAPSPFAARSIEETIRAAVPEHQTARHADTPGTDTPGTETPAAMEAVEPVVVPRDLEPEEVAPAPTPVRAFIDVPRPKHASEPEPEQILAEPVVPESGVAEPVVAEPVVAEPVVAEPVVAEPVVAEPVVAEPVVAESVVAEAEPEQTVAPQPEPERYVAPEPAPQQHLAPQPEQELEPVVAESVVAEAEPEQTVAPITVVEPEPEPVAVVEPEPEPEPIAVVVEPEPVAVVEPEPEPEVIAALESDDAPPANQESRLGSLLRRQPRPAKEAEPEPEAVAAAVEPEPEPVAVVEPEPEPEPEPEAVATPESDDEPPGDPESRLAFLLHRQPKPAKPAKQAKQARPSKQAKPARSKKPKAPKTLKPPKPGGPGTGDAARDLVAAKAAARAAAPAAPPLAADTEPVAAAVAVAAPPEPEAAPAPEKAPEKAPKKVSKHDQVAAEMPGLYTFKQKKNSRRLLTIALLVGLVVSAYFAKAAYDTQDTASMGLAAIVVLATAMLWAIRAGAAPTKLQVHQGQLEVVRQGERFVFDLASPYTQVEVRGRPGRHGWKVLFPRRGMTPFAVDSTMVDADDFMRVLRFFRPELVNH
ncbi:MAG TPA: hypothetical protein VFV89_09740 [Nocardioides sp.]|uniref:hypothetical protein n=1 Tax=Nocardioides sp. TaxID=35761 RepID=UPI002E3523D5|nr:hypothetical protein [Nocardioides sp.]HEX5088080.1 hypothetical protein [Nocardioides sp.]